LNTVLAFLVNHLMEELYFTKVPKVEAAHGEHVPVQPRFHSTPNSQKTRTPHQRAHQPLFVHKENFGQMGGHTLARSPVGATARK
jgi:hypothetical protein